MTLFPCMASVLVGAQALADARGQAARTSNPLNLCSQGPSPATCTTSDMQRDVITAITRGDEETALRILVHLKEVDFVDPGTGRTPLALATQRGHRKVVAALLKKGADPLAVDRNGRPFLYDSILSAYSAMPELSPGVIECVRMILEQADRLQRLPTKPPLDASVVFYPGARKPSLDLLKLLIVYGAEPNRKGWYVYEKSPLDAAISKNNLEAVRIMIAPGSHISKADLDEKAYDALVQRNAELLGVLRAAGADPRRHVKANPKMLFDASRRGGSKDTLEFLLKNGANPNAVENTGTKMTPLFAALQDLDKMRLLLRHGADPNARDYNGYTILAHALMTTGRGAGMTATPAPQVGGNIALLRLLIDHGADVNANNGGFGRWGALGLVRRDDKDIIEFLIQRGATLSYAVGGPSPREQITIIHSGTAPVAREAGPLIIAIEFLERDDLALAILAKGEKVNARDRLALLEATRRGWGEVARALLRAGANPNVADTEGLTPLVVAERRKDTVLAEMLVAAGAKSSLKSVKPDYRLSGWSEFDSAVAGEIDDVALFDPPRFALDLSRSGQKVTFVFNGQRPQDFVEMKCERAAQFEIIANMNTAGNIGVGICRQETQRLDELALTSRQTLETLFTQLVSGNARSDQADRKKLGLVYENRAGPSGSIIHYFPVVMIGHGVLFAPTAVLVSPKRDRAVIVQADVMGLCDEGRTMQKQTPLCTDTTSAVTEIAQRMFARFNDK